MRNTKIPSFVQEGRVEPRNDGWVVRVETRIHPRHGGWISFRNGLFHREDCSGKAPVVLARHPPHPGSEPNCIAVIRHQPFEDAMTEASTIWMSGG